MILPVKGLKIMSLLAKIIEEDFGLEGHGRWYRSLDHSSLVFDSEKDLFYFNKEGIHGDIFIYLTQVRNLSYQEAKEFIRKNNGQAVFIHTIKDTKETVVYPALVEIFHQNLLNGDRSYFYSRTINDITISRYKLGLYNEWYMIPIFQDGLFRQFQMRREIPKKSIRGYYETEMAYLFNSDILKLVDHIYIVESPISALVLLQNNIPAISYTSGSGGFMPQWYSYFLHQKEIYLLYDNDLAGEKGAYHTATILGEHRCKIYTFNRSGVEHYGPDDWFIDGNSKEDFLNLIEQYSIKSYEMERRRGKFRF